MSGQLCSRETLPPHSLGGVHKRDALYSARREPQRLVVRPWEKSLSRQARGGRVKMMTIRPPRHCRLTDSPARTDMVLFIHRTVRLIILRVADLAAAALDGHFEHPARFSLVMRDIQAGNFLTAQNRFSTAC